MSTDISTATAAGAGVLMGVGASLFLPWTGRAHEAFRGSYDNLLDDNDDRKPFHCLDKYCSSSCQFCLGTCHSYLLCVQPHLSLFLIRCNFYAVCYSAKKKQLVGLFHCSVHMQGGCDKALSYSLTVRVRPGEFLVEMATAWMRLCFTVFQSRFQYK